MEQINLHAKTLVETIEQITPPYPSPRQPQPYAPIRSFAVGAFGVLGALWAEEKPNCFAPIMIVPRGERLPREQTFNLPGLPLKHPPEQLPGKDIFVDYLTSKRDCRLAARQILLSLCR